MSELQMGGMPKEPGHRYEPRQARPRFLDVRPVHRTAVLHAQSGAAHPTKATPKQPSMPSASATSPAPTRIDYSVTSQAPSGIRRSAGHGEAKPALPRLNRSVVLRRQIVDRAAQHQKKSSSQRKQTLFAFSLGGMLVAVVMGGLFFMSHQDKPQVLSDRSTMAGIDNAAGAPFASERQVTQMEVDAYAVADNHPRIVHIPKLDLTARVYPVQEDTSGRPMGTDNINDVGWLVSGLEPGGYGAALLNGYTAGATHKGAFHNLGTLAVGDEIRIQRGDGKDLVFVVVRLKKYSADAFDMRSATQPAIAGTPGLNLLTNAEFNTRTNQHEQRVVVFAALKR